MAPNPNQNISLIIAANTDKVYPSRIEDITHDSLTIAAPMDRGKLVNVRPRTKVLIYIKGDLVEQGRYQAAGSRKTLPAEQCAMLDQVIK